MDRSLCWLCSQHPTWHIAIPEAGAIHSINGACGSVRVLKSEIEIVPVYHRLPDRIRAHALICFLALVLYHILRMRLKAAQSPVSPSRLLKSLRRIQKHTVHVGANAYYGMAAIASVDDGQRGADDRPNQVWFADITYIPMQRGFLYLVAIMDWFSRKVLAWRLSNSMDTAFCVEALKEALSKHGDQHGWQRTVD